MLYLTLARHAKSSWDSPAKKDFDRPLNKRGFNDAPLMGQVLKRKINKVDLILASPALRAITTAHLLAKEMGYPEANIQSDERLYAASHQTLLECIHQIPEQLQHVMLVAHNPGLEDMCDYLGGNEAGHMPTCAAATLEFALADWQTISQDSGKLVMYEYPKKHR